MPIQTLYQISPVGSNNKIFPQGHTYWETCDPELLQRNDPGDLQAFPNCHAERQTLLAPGPGIARSVNPVADGYMRIAGPGGYEWTWGHVTPLVAEGDTVAAGQPIARMFYLHGFDFGVWQRRDSITVGIANPARFGSNPPVHPIALYSNPLRAELIRFVPTVEGDTLGKAHWDVPGTAMGAWFLEDAPDRPLLGPDGMPYTLFLGRFTVRESTRLISVGQIWPGMQNPIHALDPAAMDWENVTPAAGRVAQRAWNTSPMGLANYSWPGGTFLVEMLAGDRLRIEWFDTHEPVTEFTAEARVYVR
ncbi:MAG: M23 family metallopeptidase [Gemmatimonadaceae bacterium]